MEMIMKNYNETIAYDKARKRVKEIRSFYISLTCYFIVVPSLAYINIVYFPGFYWFLFSMCGWGLGLFFHAMKAFNFMPFFNQEWEDKKIQELIEEDKRKKELLNHH